MLASALASALLAPGCAAPIVGQACASPRADAISWRHLDCLALHGDKHAALQLGGMFERGEGVPVDLERAIIYYRRAARDEPGVWSVYMPPAGDARYGATTSVRAGSGQTGLAAAQLALARLYAGAAPNEPAAQERAHSWALRAAKQGNPEAVRLFQQLEWGASR